VLGAVAVEGKKIREAAAVVDRDTAGEEEVEGAVDLSAGCHVGGGNWDWVAFGWCCSLGDMKKRVEEEKLRE